MLSKSANPKKCDSQNVLNIFHQKNKILFIKFCYPKRLIRKFSSIRQLSENS